MRFLRRRIYYNCTIRPTLHPFIENRAFRNGNQATVKGMPTDSLIDVQRSYSPSVTIHCNIHKKKKDYTRSRYRYLGVRVQYNEYFQLIMLC